MVNDIYQLMVTAVENSIPSYRYLLDGESQKGIPSLYEMVLEETCGKTDVSLDMAHDSILNAMAIYLEEFPGTTFERQKVWKLLWRFFSEVEELTNCFTEYRELKKEFPEPIEADMEIELLKQLHYSSRGVSKESLASTYRVSERTIKDFINKVDSKNPKSELRIAGQLVKIGIRHVDYCENGGRGLESRRRYFSASSTVNPIFLQFSIAQVHSLINGLKCSYYAEGRNMSISTATEIWSQLSDYTRSRVKLVYAANDAELSEFISIIEDEIESTELHIYRSEKDLLNESDLSEFEESEIRRKLKY